MAKRKGRQEADRLPEAVEKQPAAVTAEGSPQTSHEPNVPWPPPGIPANRRLLMISALLLAAWNLFLLGMIVWK